MLCIAMQPNDVDDFDDDSMLTVWQTGGGDSQ